MNLAILSHSDVNTRLFLDYVEALGAAAAAFDLRDLPLDGRWDGLVLDWDSLPPRQRQEFLAELRTSRAPCAVALHSFTLADVEVRALRRQGIVVGQHLDT